MDIYELIENRKSVRGYKPDPIEAETLERVLNAGRLAPSAANLQPWKFILVKDPAARHELADLCSKQRFVAQAPVVIVACALESRGMIGGVIPSNVPDTAIAVTQIMLAATAEGLGTCWIGAFENEPVKKLLAVPDNVSIVAVLPIGCPVDAARAPKARKSLDQITCEERYSDDAAG